MDFWIKFWTYFFIASIVLFSGLAVVVAIGGFFNIRTMFKDMAKRNLETEEQDITSDNQP